MTEWLFSHEVIPKTKIIRRKVSILHSQNLKKQQIHLEY